jgi:hypothetical protein
MEDPEFQSGLYSTKFMERFQERASGAAAARRLASA